MRALKWLLLSAALLVGGCAAWRMKAGADLARRSEALQQRPPAPGARLLVVGDSTAVGTGASSPERSLVGLIAAAHPSALIDNRGRDGARMADAAGQLAAATERYDVVLVLAGGNDVIRLRAIDALREDIDRVAALAAQRAPTVILMPAGNVGNAPFFFAPISWWMAQRSRDLHAAVAEAARRHGALYVNLFAEREYDPFARQPELNAADGLHPSDAGYRVWWQQLQAQAGLSQRLVAAAR